MPNDAFARAAAEDGIVLGPQTFDWLCEQGHLGLERVAKARRDPAIVEPVKSALENLSAIFARVLSRNRKLHVINEQISKAPQLRDQQVTQFVIHDGWMGIALGPKSPGRQAAMTPRRNLQRE